MTQTISLEIPDADATRRLGMALGRSLPAGTVILLDGNLGSGKTTLVQGIGEGLGISDAIVSPTFTLISEYPDGRVPLYHLDLYRLQPHEVASLYPETYWEGSEYPPGIMAIEWSDRLPYLPDAYLRIALAIAPETAPDPLSDASATAGPPGRLAQITRVGNLPLALSSLAPEISPG